MDVMVNRSTVVAFDGRVLEVFSDTPGQQWRVHLGMIASLELVVGRRAGQLQLASTGGLRRILASVDADQVGAMQSLCEEVRRATGR